MEKTKNEIIDFLENQFRTTCWGKFYSDYYVGITNNIERRLYKEHNITPYECHWVADAKDKNLADEIEKHFIDKGMKGSTGGGREDSTKIYVYRITTKTCEAPRFTDFEEELNEGRQPEPPKVEVYSGVTEMFRFYKVRVIGEKQHTGYFPYTEKKEAEILAKKMAVDINGTLIISELVGKI